MARLSLYEVRLRHWQRRVNLVSDDSLADPWRRHFLDSLQLVPLLPAGRVRIVDLGSGAGFPGLVLAAAMAEASVTLIEANAKKAAFLEDTAARMGVAVDVRNRRIETITGLKGDVIVARACAPLVDLLDMAGRFTVSHRICLFLKGRSVDDELTAARKRWNMAYERFGSRTSPDGAILRIGAFARV